MVTQWVTLLMMVLWGCEMAYIFSGVWLITETALKKCHHNKRINGIWRWSKWPALAYTLGDIPMQIIIGEKVGMFDYLSFGLNLWIWYFYRNAGDDDPMNKLRKKITEKVAEIGGKLVLVPAGA